MHYIALRDEPGSAIPGALFGIGSEHGSVIRTDEIERLQSVGGEV